jgi:HSP20 family protein
MRILPYRQHLPLNSIHNVMDELFDRNIKGILGSDQIVTWPHANVRKDKSHYMIELSVPGFEKNNFEIMVKGDKLIVETIKKNESNQAISKVKWLRREFNYDQFKRMFKLPENASTENIEAVYELGILKIKINKKSAEGEDQPLKIVVG